MIWWEKTVEYTFVLRAVEEGIFDLFAPLDGNEESIGDTVVCRDSLYYIIEFKKKLSDLSAEYSKFENGKQDYSSAAEEMRKDKSSKYHFLIGGKVSKNNKYLSLEIINYFCIECNLSKSCRGRTHSENCIGPTPSEDMKIFPQNGMTEDELYKYTKKITKFKKNGEEDGEEDGEEGTSSRGFSTSYVLAVSKSEKTKKGNRGTLISLEYFNNRKLEKNMKEDAVNTYSPKFPRR